MRIGSQLFQGQRGLSLLETLVAVGILAAIGAVFAGAMYTTYKNVGMVDEKQLAESLIRSQLEEIKGAPYSDNASYPVTVSIPSHYSMTIGVTSPTCIGRKDDCVPLDTLVGFHVTTIQEITVSVHHDTRPVLSVACYKVKE